MTWPKYSYYLSRPYTGRYTTPIVTLLVVGITVLLVLINIPLSGYETRQDFTYTPNLTSTTVPYSNLIPAAFRKRPVDFVPHTFNIGDTFQTDSDFGVFRYTIQKAYTRADTAGSSTPRMGGSLPSFAYMNHDFSSCDVAFISLSVAFNHSAGTQGLITDALVSCWFPLFYQFHAIFGRYGLQASQSDVLKVGPALSSVFSDMTLTLVNTVYPPPITVPSVNPNVSLTALNITYQRCCATCDESPWNWPRTLEPYEITTPDTPEIFYYDHPTCDDQAVKFKLPSLIPVGGGGELTSQILSFADGADYPVTYGNIGDVWSSLVNAPPLFPALSNNALQALYHAVRLDLGIIRPNQIYNSPARFNASISEIYGDKSNIGLTNKTRMERDSVGNVDLSSFPKRVPKILYLTSVLKRKPLGQAITAIFVATFSMLTALWATGNFIASSCIRMRSKQAMYCPCPTCQCPDPESHLPPMQLEVDRLEGTAK